MNKKVSLLLPFFCLLAACDLSHGLSPSGQGKLEDLTYYAYFMNNYPRVKEQSVNGYDELINNSLYLRKEIEIDKPFTKPETDPTRENYEFQGWFKEKGCLNAWDFAKDTTKKTVYLYAKWGQTQSEEYMEPEYHYPEKIITDANYRVTGILNKPLSGDSVNLTDGAIKRLERTPNDIKFAVNYERKEGVTLTTATYDVTNKTIHLEVSSGEVFDITVNNITASLAVNNSYYEGKATSYETKSANVENYHIALAGSSSMENWSTSALDMSPIVTFNHGIGGTTVDQWRDQLFERLVQPYSPKAVVYYVGVNNVINGDKESGTAVAPKLKQLFDKTHNALPHAQIFYVLINRLPNYEKSQEDFDIVNNSAIAYAESHSYLTCIDAGHGLLNEEGRPNSAYFLTDGLHMSKYGYVIWGQAVKEAIIAWLESTKE